MGPDWKSTPRNRRSFLSVIQLPVAVQNQAGRFPKKWDKTGKVVENQDYDKVLIKLDGSGRLTTRNRRFVKKIVSPPDLADRNVPHLQTNPVLDHEDIHDVSEDVTPAPVFENESMEDIRDDLDQTRHVNEGDVGVTNDVMNEIADDMARQTDQIPKNRPRRDRKQNVRYSSEEYDLSAVSGRYRRGARLTLSGIYVQPEAEKLKNAGQLIRKRTNKRK